MIRYLVLDIAMLTLTIFLAYTYGNGLGFGRRLWFLLIPVLILTSIFDNILTALPIVTYIPNHILGLHIGTVPVEDFAYAIAAVILVPALNRKFLHGDH